VFGAETESETWAGLVPEDRTEEFWLSFKGIKAERDAERMQNAVESLETRFFLCSFQQSEGCRVGDKNRFTHK
ncbi:Chaperone protein FocC, partial [Clarias magur]